MKKYLFVTQVCLFIVFICTSFVQAAAVDASKFDLLGVRLGMPQNEALKILTTALGVDLNAIQWKKNVISGEYDYTDCTINNNNSKYEISFFESGGKGDRSKMIVKSIRYEIPNSPENRIALRKSAISKYGPPSNAAYPKNSAEWCIRPDKYLSACHAYDGPQLRCEQVGTPSLTLSDPSMGKQSAPSPKAVIPEL